MGWLWVLMVAAAAFGAEYEITVSGLVKDHESTIRAVRQNRVTYLDLDDIESRVPVAVTIDTLARVGVLAGPANCVAFYLDDEEEYGGGTGRGYVAAEVLGKAFDARISRGGKKRLEFSVERPLGGTRPGPEVDHLAPGFMLRDQHDTEVNSRALLEQSGLVVAFVRSGLWDPLSRDLLRKLSANRDAIAAAGYAAVVIHGYAEGDGRAWSDSLRIVMPLLADGTAAVMRGYGVFDQGHLPHCALIVIDREGMIRWRKVMTAGETEYEITELLNRLKAK